MKRFLLSISSLFMLVTLSHGQGDSTTVDTLSGRYQELISVGQLFVPTVTHTLAPGCGISCHGASEYHLRTGYFGFDGDAVPIGPLLLDPSWKIIEDNCAATIEPRNALVQNLEDNWGDLGCVIDGVSEDYKLILTGTPDAPQSCRKGTFRYQTKFCVSGDASGISLDLKCLSDNVATVYLNGIEIGTQGDDLSYEGWKTENRLDISLTGFAILTTGENILEVEVKSSGVDVGLGLYLGIEVQTGCVGCCFQNGAINGYKFNDLNANGTLEIGEPGIEGVEFELYDITDPGSPAVYVTSVFTDETGYYQFVDVTPTKTYEVREVLPGWTNTVPGTGSYTDLYIGEGSTINNLLFLNTEINDHEIPCEDCGDSFAPIPGKRYWISAWVNVESGLQQKTYDQALDGPFLRTIFLGTDEIIPEFYPTGEIIDGWQRIVGSFIVPEDATNFLLTMNADPNFDTYFDDIRIHPFNGSMKSYVYDGETFWLTSELDDNNYATFYEYDEEGGLIRIKKETARGIVTIQDTRSSTIKK